MGRCYCCDVESDDLQRPQFEEEGLWCRDCREFSDVSSPQSTSNGRLSTSSTLHTPLSMLKAQSSFSATPLPVLSGCLPPTPSLTEIGRGSGVIVYRIPRDTPSRVTRRSPWAAKKLVPECGGRARRTFTERLQHEASLLELVNHPNVVGFRGFGRDRNNNVTLLMEYGGPQNLMDMIEERLESGKRFTQFEVHTVALAVARGLHHLHVDCGLLHGDMKSANVVVSNDLQVVKICDIGVALQFEEDTKTVSSSAYVGTEPWSAPEIHEGKSQKIDAKADIFSYGLTIWEMLALAVPHVDHLSGDEDDDDALLPSDLDKEHIASLREAEYQKVLGSCPPLPQKVIDDPSFGWAVELVVWTTAREPSARPSALEIVRSLEEGLP